MQGYYAIILVCNLDKTKLLNDIDLIKKWMIISENLREEVEDFFRTRDRDFDGFLSFEEFLGEESQIEKLFKKMDKDNDGKVSKQVSRKHTGN